ncbi:cutinase family protein [Segniliparus rugosus]|uniref:Cutinase n=1 Tax=Segniliparus rugosus (strain ATCC BAA-974 / DSM 45345 / CCUG 50838 / CIP 108380 / JCM 13579 / CDC 945) TaxID=679197 RepID=E5XPT8_SEGRC|nr:cutinase family protein [Segniliparus rugosus]EFV13625.1 hypothetical protein HMPREF9336_01510 [Segniliparus rugosus ATCC BAA-974]
MIASKLALGAFGGLLSLMPVFAVPAVTPMANAEPAGCAQYDISFARGTHDAPGLGNVGNAFVNAVKAKAPGKTFSVYAVDYPADFDFAKASDGGADLSNHLQDVANRCPATQFVLGGYSQGAAVVDSVISLGVPVLGFTNPLPGDVAERIAAVALFGDFVHRFFNGPQPIFITPDLAGKVTDVCADGDPICWNLDGDFNTQKADFDQNHVSYVSRGLTSQAADFVVERINDQPAQAAPAPQPPATPEAEAPEAAAPAAPEAEAPEPDSDAPGEGDSE